jgi:hypothetical protein
LSCKEFLEALEDPMLADDVELAIGIRNNELPTLKLTAFFVSQGDSSQVGGKVGDYLKQQGCELSVLNEAVVEAARDVESMAVEEHPYHGVGIELPMETTPKVNVYLRPVI